MSRIHFSAPIYLKAAAGQPRRFKIVAYNGGPMVVAGFDLPVIVDLTALEVPESIPILVDHTNSVPTTVGQTDRIDNTGRSLVLAGPVTVDSPRDGVPLTPAQQVVARSDPPHNHKWQASVGVMVQAQQRIPAGQTVQVNGQSFVGPVIVARQSKLFETSTLAGGADSTTSVNLAAAAAGQQQGKNMNFETWCEDMGIDPAKLSERVREILMKEFDAEQNGAVEEGVPATASAVANLRASAVADVERIAAVNLLASGYPHICATAIRQGWSADKTELAVLKHQRREHAPDNRVRYGGEEVNDKAEEQVLCASLLMRCNEKLAVKAYGERACETAKRRRISSLVDLAGASLRAAGRSPESYENRDAMLRAAFSTTSLPTILSSTVGRSLIDAYEETTSDWKKFCYVASAEDFRTQTGIRPSALANLDELPPNGNIKHAVLKEENTFSWSVKTYAEMIQVGRQTIINDDLGFIDQIAPMFGIAAGRTLLDLIWATIMGGQTANYFSSGNGNLLTSSSALAVGSLGVAVAAMKSQTDSAGNNIANAPVALVVPPGLELTARNILSSAERIGVPASNALEPNGNPAQNIVPNLIVEPRLANARFTGYDVDAWFLFANPNARPVTVGFLQSQQTPTIEMDDAPFHQLGQQMRVVFDFGCALGDPKGGYKATGA